MLISAVRKASLSKVILRYTNNFTQERLLTPAMGVKRDFLKQVIIRTTSEFTQERLLMLKPV